VLGQYTAVGEKTNLGLGRYVIEELQSVMPIGLPRHLRVPRASSLVSVAMARSLEIGNTTDSPVNKKELSEATELVEAGRYEPQCVHRFLLPGDKPRLISVPSRIDRILQRGILETLNEPVDTFLSESCIAYRQGLSRKNAADRIRLAYQQGYRWSLKADFHRFFDSIDHRLLEDKLEAYLQDDKLVHLVMQFVSSGSPQPGRGIATGSVISPLLANLFCEQFDRQVHDDGGYLVRYADDFVILFRDPNIGEQRLQQVIKIAERLKLHLNESKIQLIDLNTQPFDFLGLRFFVQSQWQFCSDGLREIQDLGWTEVEKTRPKPQTRPLPGERQMEATRSATTIVGPDVDWIGIDDGDIVCRSHRRGCEDRFPVRRARELVVLGNATLDRTLFTTRDESRLSIFMGDDYGRWRYSLKEQPPHELADLVRAQIALESDGERKLSIGRQLIFAKLNNYAALTRAYPARGTASDLANRLCQFANDATKATSEAELLGIEGAGAAAWYGELHRRIAPNFSFDRREHPSASDPVNVMLNLTQTLLHRIVALSLVREGFAVSIGVLHHSRSGHAALASDLQEPFRYLMDRVVIETTYNVSPGEFHRTDRGPFALRIGRGTYRTIVASVFRMLSVQCEMAGVSPRCYRRWLTTTARSLHHHLLDPGKRLRVPQHH